MKLKSDCSKPINLGDQFGAMQVVGIDSKELGAQSMGATVTYTYAISNTGAAPVNNITVIDDQLGTIPGSPIASLGPGQSTNLMASAFVIDNTTNTVIVTGNGGACSATASAIVSKPSRPCPCTLGYPFVSSNLRTSVAFNESEVLRAFSPNVVGPGDTLKVWYNDEHALTLGIRRVVVKTSSGTIMTDYPVSPLTAVPGSVTNPQVGTTALTDDQAGTDPVGRPIWPALFITDITDDPNSKTGDWQFGGTPIPPHAVFGTWKSAVKVMDKTRNPATMTVTADADPAKNNWNLGAGDFAPSNLKNEGYGAEVRWNVDDLIAAGSMQSGRVYRVQFMVHDGDQNKVGGDSGEGCAIVAIGASFDCPPAPR